MSNLRNQRAVQRAVYISSFLKSFSAEQWIYLQSALSENGHSPSFPSCLYGWSLNDLRKLYRLTYHVE